MGQRARIHEAAITWKTEEDSGEQAVQENREEPPVECEERQTPTSGKAFCDTEAGRHDQKEPQVA